MKKTIFRKISLDSLNFFFLTILSIGAIIWVLQAVNFLDFIIEDGHSIGVYLSYTLLSLPKIISKILPFALFLSFLYVLLKYEDNNELIIFWSFGIHKVVFANFFIKFSFLFVIFQLLFTLFIVPFSGDKARSYIRSSDIDLFESLIKQKKFVDAVKNLTIFVNEKDELGVLKNIFLKDNSGKSGYQITFAKTGKFEKKGTNKILVLYDGKTITHNNGELSGFEFSKSDFNISKFNTSTTQETKTQENLTTDLVKCVYRLFDIKITEENYYASFEFNNCRHSNSANIMKELYKRLILPFYLPIFTLIALFLIIKSKNHSTFKSLKTKIFISGVVLIIFSEVSLKFIQGNIYKNIPLIILPIVIFIFIYLIFLQSVKKN